MTLPNEDYQPDAPPPPGAELRNFGEVLLHAVARFPMTIILCTATGSTLALAFGLAQPNQYVSVGLLLLRLGAREQQTPESTIIEGAVARGPSVATGDELLILRNPELHERVTDEIGAQTILEPYDPASEDGPNTPWHTRWLHDLQARLVPRDTLPEVAGVGTTTELMHEAAVEQLTDSVSINAQRHSSTLVVSYTAHCPELAQRIASAYMKACQERHREVYGTSNELSFITEQLEEAETEKAAAEVALQEQRDEDGVYDLHILQEGLAGEIQTLDARIEQDTIQLQSLGGQLEVLDAQLTSSKRESVDQIEGAEPTNSDSPVMLTSRYEWLLAQHRDVNSELAEAEKTFLKGSDLYESEHQRLQGRLDEIQQEITRVEERLVSQVSTLSPQPGFAPQNVVHDGLILQRVEVRRQQEGLRVGIEARTGLLQSRKDRLRELVSKETVYARLKQAVTAASDSTTRLRKARAHQRTLEAIDSDESMTSLIVTQEATLPVKKEGPNRSKFLALGLFGGIFLGLATAIVRQLLDSRLRYPKCIETSLGIRVLGVVPEESRWRRQGNRLRRHAA
jgi:uncharacterized protein involved in exopolysaccharide biosynthesis